jgi:hypothetical protein
MQALQHRFGGFRAHVAAGSTAGPAFFRIEAGADRNVDGGRRQSTGSTATIMLWACPLTFRRKNGDHVQNAVRRGSL